jgi:hypothetical protein
MTYIVREWDLNTTHRGKFFVWFLILNMFVDDLVEKPKLVTRRLGICVVYDCGLNIYIHSHTHTYILVQLSSLCKKSYICTFIFPLPLFNNLWSNWPVFMELIITVMSLQLLHHYTNISKMWTHEVSMTLGKGKVAPLHAVKARGRILTRSLPQ